MMCTDPDLQFIPFPGNEVYHIFHLCTTRELHASGLDAFPDHFAGKGNDGAEGNSSTGSVRMAQPSDFDHF